MSVQNTLAKVILQNSYGESLTLEQHEIGKIVKTSWINFPNNCAPLSLPTSNLTHGVGDVWMEFNVIDNLNYTATIVLQDRMFSTDRSLKRSKFYYHGPRVSVDVHVGKSGGIVKKFMVALNQRVYLEEDASKNCRDYPNDKFESYNDCDKAFTSKFLFNHFGHKFVPIWSATDLKEVTVLHNNSRVIEEDVLGQMMQGTLGSTCPASCTSTTIRVRAVSKLPDPKRRALRIFFVDTVEVTKTDFISTTFSIILSNIGGSMGLWLGLGAAQAAGLLINAGANLAMRLRGMAWARGVQGATNTDTLFII